MRSFISLHELKDHIPDLQEFLSAYKATTSETAEVDIKYEGYISREKLMAEKITRLEKIKLDPKLNYDKLKSLSTEARQKLKKIQPTTIGQATRISGVNPADINILLILMGR